MIQVETPDRLGLLYDLVSCLGRNNVYITLSRISTDKGAAIDTFYVTDATTRGKITDAKWIEQLQQRCKQPRSRPPNDNDRRVAVLPKRPMRLPSAFHFSMNVLILAAGYATRLYPLTENKAKPLLEVAGKPMIEWVLDNLAPDPGSRDRLRGDER